MTTTNISSAIESLIEGSQKELFLVSPYMRIHRRLEQLALESIDKGVCVYLVFGKDRDQSYIRSSPLIERASVFYCDRLHAKCYMSENECIVTSMNLYDYSQVNNIEFGILLEAKEENFLAVRGEIIRVLKDSEPFNVSAGDTLKRVGDIENPIFMRDLRKDLDKARKVRDYDGKLYTEVCKYLMSIHAFEKKELYEDGNGILAATKINKELYLAAFKNFK